MVKDQNVNVLGEITAVSSENYMKSINYIGRIHSVQC
jgi:hypothetical protein